MQFKSIYSLKVFIKLKAESRLWDKMESQDFKELPKKKRRNKFKMNKKNSFKNQF